ncbi:MAG: alcohol dehydrogenase catalytic domain-containing protein, partial [Trueperaceae bacterium]
MRIHAASVNHADATITSGAPYVLRLALGLRRPKNAIRGQDFAGRVEAIGSEVTRFLPGDEVFAEVAGGSFAEFACIAEAALVAKPGNLT